MKSPLKAEGAMSRRNLNALKYGLLHALNFFLKAVEGHVLPQQAILGPGPCLRNNVYQTIICKTLFTNIVVNQIIVCIFV